MEDENNRKSAGRRLPLAASDHQSPRASLPDAHLNDGREGQSAKSHHDTTFDNTNCSSDKGNRSNFALECVVEGKMCESIALPTTARFSEVKDSTVPLNGSPASENRKSTTEDCIPSVANGSVPHSDYTPNNLPLDSKSPCLTKIAGQRNTAIVDERRKYHSFSTGDSEYDFNLKASTCRCMEKRYVLALLSFFGFFNVYCLRVDLSVALVAMTNNHTRIRYDGSEYWVAAEFDWSPQIQGHILGAFYYGYLLTQIPGGYIAARFGGKSLFGLAIMLAAILTLITPVASRKHWLWLFLLRLTEGICEGCIYPAMYAIWSRWAPPNERARLATIPHSGSYAGSVVGTLVAGYLCEICGWAWVFYLFAWHLGKTVAIGAFTAGIISFGLEVVRPASRGDPIRNGFTGKITHIEEQLQNSLFALMWVAIWMIMISDSPEFDPHISENEKNFILKSLQDDHTSEPVKGTLPWRSIFTSMPFLAIFVAHTCEGWGFSTLQTSLPKFLSEALNMRIFHSGAYTATMYFIMGVVVMVAGRLSDLITERCDITKTNVRKVFTAMGFIPNAVALLISVHLNSARAALIVLAIGTGVESIAWSGFAINHLDIAPRYASLLFGVTNTAATVPGVLSPMLVGSLTGHGTRDEWTLVFYISAMSFLFGAVFYAAFGSAERQPWGIHNHFGEYDSIEKGSKPIESMLTEKEEPSPR